MVAQISYLGLEACYPFKGFANDASGNSLNGNVVGVKLTSDKISAHNSCYTFDFASIYFFFSIPSKIPT
jgi:hypothetical protein